MGEFIFVDPATGRPKPAGPVVLAPAALTIKARDEKAKKHDDDGGFCSGRESGCNPGPEQRGSETEVLTC